MPRARRISSPIPGLFLLTLWLGAGCAGSRRESALLERFEFTQPQMGVPFRIVLYATGRPAAERAARAAFARISELNDIMSDYDTDSELNRLSRTAGTGQAVSVSPDLWRVLEQSQALASRSGGAFDVTVGPCVSLWRKARREKKLPRPDLLAKAVAATGWQKLQLDSHSRTAKLLVPEMKLDLGGIAKGYATDQALKTLRRHGITRALVAGGGDMSAGDPPPGKTGWRIEVAPLDVTNAPPPRFVWLARAGLATSGDVFQRVEMAGVRYSHIVDPKTGVGLTDHSLVTVIAPDCTTADGLATAVSVLGPERGLKLIESTPGAAACIARQPGQEIERRDSSRFRKHLEPGSSAATAP
jgi:thiamine biosynthesis lipoprotein